MEGSLFNSGFLGSKFLWWIGQVADDRTWRENQNPKKIEDPEEDQPAWGYRYKVRIMGIHDQSEASIESDNLPWAQVMYSVWGGGLAGSRQTPLLHRVDGLMHMMMSVRRFLTLKFKLSHQNLYVH